jgi:hypothetical protein
MSVVINGNGTFTGLAAGGLGVDTVTNNNLATGIDAIKLTGSLPALDATALTNIPSPSSVDANILYGILPSLDASQLINIPSPSSIDASSLYGILPSLDASQLTNIPSASSIDASILYGSLDPSVSVDGNSITGLIPGNIDWSYTPIGSVPANLLQGPMPAIDGSALTNLPGGGGAPFVEDTSVYAIGVGTNAKIGTSLFYNTSFGDNAGSNISGSGRTAIGANALKDDVAGENTAVGSNAGATMNTGYSSSSTLIGASAGRYGQHEQNTYIGGAAGNNASSGYNVGVGFAAGYNTISGLSNTSIGNNAYENGTGSDNVSVGAYAGHSVSTSQCTHVGRDAGRFGITNDNQTCIGFGSEPGGGIGEVTLGNFLVSTLRCATQTISSLSDSRDKTDVSDLSYGLDFINKTRPVEFKWESRDGHSRDGQVSNGFIAQELLALGNNEQHSLVNENNPEKLEAAYAALVPMMVKAIQELSAKVEELENK